MPKPAGPDVIDVQVGRRILVRRKEQRLSQSRLAEYLGVTFQQVQKYERGANRVSASTLVRIAACLETTVADMVGEGRTAGVDGCVLEQLAAPCAMAMLEAYAGVGDERQRAAILALVRRMARA